MAIYDASGNQLFEAYDAQGNALNYAYDAEGNVIFQRGGQTEIRVMEYNVGQWYTGTGTNVPANQDAEYYALQNGMIQNADADVMFICEYWNNMSKLPRTAESMLSQYFPYILTQGGSSGYFGRAICSKYPLTNWTHRSYSNESNRYYDSAEITVDDKQITLVVTHLATDSKRSAQVVELITYLSTLDRFICAGDFNPLTIHDGITTEADDYALIIAPLLDAGFHLANCSNFGFIYTYSSAPSGSWNGCLDNVVTSPNITITGVHVDTTKLTDEIEDLVDHMPLIADLSIY